MLYINLVCCRVFDTACQRRNNGTVCAKLKEKEKKKKKS